MQNRFRDALEAGSFVVSCELIPGRGASEPSQEAALQNAWELWATGRVHAISITDNPGGNPALAPAAFASSLSAEGILPLIHLSCKDANRNQMESKLYALQRAGLQNLLCMTGDYPSSGFRGRPKPVFDLDPVTLLQQLSAMNQGMAYPDRKGVPQAVAPAQFFPGCVVSPFKWTEAETLAQLYKLKKKAAAGARYAIAQVGYDARKLQEMLFLMADAGIKLPLIANVYILSAATGAVMNRGVIPGCDVSDELLTVLRSERDASADKGLAARLERAARMVAIAKGLGCAGVHIGGPDVNASNVCAILDMAAAFESDWQASLPAMAYPQKNCFYAYELDAATGLNSRVAAPRVESFRGRDVQGTYGISRRFHKLVFLPGKGLNRVFVARQKALEAKKGRLRTHGLEHLSKMKLYGCQDCGDCGLYATAYSCPMSQCPKQQRNGACGGSKDGWCEVYPAQRRCVWFSAYHRLKPYGEQDELGAYIVPPVDWSCRGCSAWGSTVLELDGYAHRIFLDDPDKEQ